MSTTSNMTGIGGNTPDRVASGLYEDRLAVKQTIRQQVDVAAATILAHLAKLPEHKGEDTAPEMEATSHRLTMLRSLLNSHFEVE